MVALTMWQKLAAVTLHTECIPIFYFWSLDLIMCRGTHSTYKATQLDTSLGGLDLCNEITKAQSNIRTNQTSILIMRKRKRFTSQVNTLCIMNSS